jgi:hypothetical protein
MVSRKVAMNAKKAKKTGDRGIQNTFLVEGTRRLKNARDHREWLSITQNIVAEVNTEIHLYAYLNQVPDSIDFEQRNIETPI